MSKTERSISPEVVQLLQTYARLAELEINAGESRRRKRWRCRTTLPSAFGRVEGEEAKEREKEELVGELSAAMRTRGHDPTPIREAMGG